MSASLKWILQITNCDDSLADLTLSQLASWDSGMSRADGIACLWGFWALPFFKKKIRCFSFSCLVIHPLLNFFFFSPNSFQTLQWWNLQKDSTHTDRRLRLFSQPVPAHFLTACFHNVFLRRCSTGASQHGKLCVAVWDHRCHRTNVSPSGHEDVWPVWFESEYMQDTFCISQESRVENPTLGLLKKKVFLIICKRVTICRYLVMFVNVYTNWQMLFYCMLNYLEMGDIVKSATSLENVYTNLVKYPPQQYTSF